MINEAAARRFFGDRDPLGAEIRLYGAARPIVGIVGNEHFFGLAEAPPLAVYLPMAQAPPQGRGVLLARTASDPTSLTGPLRAAIADLDPGLAVFGVEPLTETVSRSIAERRFTMLVLGLFAAVALLLAAIGIYGVLSYTVTQRTAELGIRMALGADPGGLLRMVVGGGVALAGAGAGVVVGLAGAWALTRLLESLLFGLAPTDPAVFATVALGLLAVAALASYLPARRATRIDPVTALRVE